jgi:hypothetical protein
MDLNPAFANIVKRYMLAVGALAARDVSEVAAQGRI